tara:strand:+ start:981 stop:1199 length:219 start_codon:yes stop_codon:yes gene_type:complete
MANLSTIKEKKKKTKSKKKSTPKKDMKIAYTPKTEKEKADAYTSLVRKLKSGELTPEYRWHGGGRRSVSDRD